jgi:hypothetical protein
LSEGAGSLLSHGEKQGQVGKKPGGREERLRLFFLFSELFQRNFQMDFEFLFTFGKNHTSKKLICSSIYAQTCS